VSWPWHSCHGPAAGRGQASPVSPVTTQVSSDTQRRLKRGPSLISHPSRSSPPDRSKRRQWARQSGSTPRRTLRQPATAQGRSRERRPSGSGMSRSRSVSHSPASRPSSISEAIRSARQPAGAGTAATDRLASAAAPRRLTGRSLQLDHGCPPQRACQPTGRAGTRPSKRPKRDQEAP
jgi:hypothetical protein